MSWRLESACKGLAGDERFRDLPLERCAVAPVSRYGFHPPEASKGGRLIVQAASTGAHSMISGLANLTASNLGQRCRGAM
jgi:hypothetical protein